MTSKSVDTFKAHLAAFREHARKLKALGFVHVSAKVGQHEFHVEGTGPTPTEHVGGGIPIGFDSGEDE